MQLSRNRVVKAAIELIERDGVEAVSMSRLAAELGCGLITLYRFLPSRSAMQEAVADAVISEIEFVPPPGGSWPQRVRAQATAVRLAARRHPRCAAMAFSQPRRATAALPPVEETVASLQEAGFCTADSVKIVFALFAYVLGSVPLAEADFEFGLDLLVRAAAALRQRPTSPRLRRGYRPAGCSVAPSRRGRSTPAPNAMRRASTTGTVRACRRPSALARPPISTGPPSMPA